MPVEIETYRNAIYPWQCDSMGHMNTQFYTAIFFLFYPLSLIQSPSSKKCFSAPSFVKFCPTGPSGWFCWLC